jgi:hypothetical protein
MRRLSLRACRIWVRCPVKRRRFELARIERFLWLTDASMRVLQEQGVKIMLPVSTPSGLVPSSSKGGWLRIAQGSA